MPELMLAARQLLVRPGFTAVVVMTFALGIGATTAIFSVVNAVLIAPLPYPEPSRLVQVYEESAPGQRNAVAGGAYKDWVEHSTQFEYLAIAEQTRANLTGGGEPEDLTGLLASADFLRVLGVMPALGRDLRPGDDRVGGDNAIILLTHALWQRRFGGDDSIVGRTVVLDQVPHTVVGVLPPAALPFDWPDYVAPAVIDHRAEAWGRAGHWRTVFGRLAAGATAASAQTELRGIKQRLNDDYPAWKRDWSVGVAPLRELFAGDVRPTLVMLFGTAALVLLIACVNVSNLLLARGRVRNREMAIRAALGATRGRIASQVLAESVLLALAGCAAGVALAVAGVDILGATVARGLPQILQPRLDLAVLGFSIAVAAACGLLFGALPALRAASPRLAGVLQDGARGSGSASAARAQRTLLAAQVAFTVVLLVGAGLFLRSFAQLAHVNPGFDAEQVLAFDLSLPAAKYPDPGSRHRFVTALTDELRSLPGVTAVGSSAFLPLSGNGQSEMVSRADLPPRDDYLIGLDWVSGEYFAALGVALLRGRVLTDADFADGAPRRLVVNARLAQDLFGDGDPVGQQLRLFGQEWEIVGVVEQVRHLGLHRPPMPRAYAPQFIRNAPPSMVVRTALPPLELAATARDAVHRLDSDQPVSNVRALDRDVGRSLGGQRAILALVGVFAAVALALACVGIYGVVAYVVSQRTREISIRMALGAGRAQVVRTTLFGGLRVAALGAAVGLAGALALSRYVDGLLYEVSARDPAVFATATAVLLAVAALAAWLPARRAARLDPMDALRSE